MLCLEIIAVAVAEFTVHFILRIYFSSSFAIYFFKFFLLCICNFYYFTDSVLYLML
jgi:hypothetical protein